MEKRMKGMKILLEQGQLTIHDIETNADVALALMEKMTPAKLPKLDGATPKLTDGVFDVFKDLVETENPVSATEYLLDNLDNEDVIVLLHLIVFTGFPILFFEILTGKKKK